MKIQEIKETFPDSEIRDGDLGEYIEIRLLEGVYLSVYKRTEVVPDLEVYGNIINMPYIKSIDDVKILYKLFSGKNETTQKQQGNSY